MVNSLERQSTKACELENVPSEERIQRKMYVAMIPTEGQFPGGASDWTLCRQKYQTARYARVSAVDVRSDTQTLNDGIWNLGSAASAAEPHRSTFL
jgi:hypothetical protein